MKINKFANNSLMQYKPLLAILASMAICLSSCNGDKQTHEPPTIALSGGVDVRLADDYFTGCNRKVFSDTLMEMKIHSDSLFAFYRFGGDTLEYIDSFGSRGEGPNELNYGKIAKSPAGDYIIIDSPSGIITKVYNIPGDAIHDRSKWTHSNLDSLSIMTSAYTWLNDSCILMSSAPFGKEKSIFSIIDYKNGTSTPTDFWPDDGYSGPAYPKLFVYCSNATLRSNGADRYLYASIYGEYAFIFTLDGQKVNIVNHFLNEPVGYKASTDGLNAELHHNKPQLILFSANSKHIYVFHYNRLEDGTLAEDIFDIRTGKDIDVYDWDGNLVKRYVLDRLGLSIEVNGDDTELYLQTADPDGEGFEWVRYDIK